MKKYWQLLVVIVLALTIRLYQFGQIPYGLNRDELALGYNAFLISRTAKDEYDRLLPLRFESFGDWKQPVYIYLTVPFIWLLGLTPIAVRLPALVANLSLIPAVYLIINKILSRQPEKHWVGLLTALLVSLNPWSFHLSRIALEAMVALAFFTWSVWFLIKQNKRHKFIGLFFLTLSLFSYHGSLVFIPLWFFVYWITNFKTLKQEKLFVFLSIVFLVIIGCLYTNNFFTPEKVKAQGLLISDLTNQEKLDQIYRFRNNSFLSPLIHNQYVYLSRVFISNYLQTFTPKFLLIQGAEHPNYNVFGFGNFFWPEIILAIIGIFYLFKLNRQTSLLLLSWLLIAPIPAAITKQAIHSVREIFLLPIMLLIAGLGLVNLIKAIKIHASLVAAFMAAILLIFAWPFYHYYFSSYRQISDHFFHGYYQSLFQDLDVIGSDYEDIIFTNPSESPYIFYAFYHQLDPATFFSTVVRYDPDKEGFKHVKNLSQLQFRSLNLSELQETSSGPLSLIIIRSSEVKNWMPIIKTWDNLEEQPELTAFATNAL